MLLLNRRQLLAAFCVLTFVLAGSTSADVGLHYGGRKHMRGNQYGMGHHHSESQGARSLQELASSDRASATAAAMSHTQPQHPPTPVPDLSQYSPSLNPPPDVGPDNSGNHGKSDNHHNPDDHHNNDDHHNHDKDHPKPPPSPSPTPSPSPSQDDLPLLPSPDVSPSDVSPIVYPPLLWPSPEYDPSPLTHPSPDLPPVPDNQEYSEDRHARPSPDLPPTPSPERPSPDLPPTPAPTPASPDIPPTPSPDGALPDLLPSPAVASPDVWPTPTPFPEKPSPDLPPTPTPTPTPSSPEAPTTLSPDWPAEDSGTAQQSPAYEDSELVQPSPDLESSTEMSGGSALQDFSTPFEESSSKTSLKPGLDYQDYLVTTDALDSSSLVPVAQTPTPAASSAAPGSGADSPDTVLTQIEHQVQNAMSQYQAITVQLNQAEQADVPALLQQQQSARSTLQAWLQVLQQAMQPTLQNTLGRRLRQL